ncbi:MAG: hypothetical protein WCI73_07485, partial [Phycisphaerae bacterium]
QTKEINMKTDPTNNARDAYQARTKDINRLIGLLKNELATHAQTSEANPKNWGYAGDLGKVRNDLIELVGFLSNTDRDKVEQYLADGSAKE